MAIPASSMVATDVPVGLEAMRYTRALAARPPAKAPSVTREKLNSPPAGGQSAPTTIMQLAPAEAPLVTPIREGSARGLRNSPCITAPLIARIAPTTMASNTRGRRMACRIIHSRAVSGVPVPFRPAARISGSRRGEMDTGPASRATSSTAGSNRARASKRVAGAIRLTAAPPTR